MMKTSKTIGIVSDTHGLLRDEVRRKLRGCDLILHAGDIGHPSVLDELRRIADVVAVRGNVDTGSWADELRREEYVEVYGRTRTGPRSTSQDTEESLWRSSQS